MSLPHGTFWAASGALRTKCARPSPAPGCTTPRGRHPRHRSKHCPRHVCVSHGSQRGRPRARTAEGGRYRAGREGTGRGRPDGGRGWDSPRGAPEYLTGPPSEEKGWEDTTKNLTAVKRLAKDLLHPSPEEEKRKHKKKRLVQSPNSYFMDVKCPGCYKITTVFSHAQTVVLCVGCSTVLCQPTGGKARLTEVSDAPV
ncbi:40S ribosomal protein S27 isoform X2 [Panthera uncia]|uniref:40S ribosomal protein S27 isoform X2 n=1 Tax=Panthera uncia TaxID=29064 RepID=UPI0020FF8AD6|nr:40S ribosomal protein S27 isoform X2 [Panthera uncia]